MYMFVCQLFSIIFFTLQVSEVTSEIHNIICNDSILFSVDNLFKKYHLNEEVCAERFKSLMSDEWKEKGRCSTASLYQLTEKIFEYIYEDKNLDDYLLSQINFVEGIERAELNEKCPGTSMEYITDNIRNLIGNNTQSLIYIRDHLNIMESLIEYCDADKLDNSVYDDIEFLLNILNDFKTQSLPGEIEHCSTNDMIFLEKISCFFGNASTEFMQKNFQVHENFNCTILFENQDIKNVYHRIKDKVNNIPATCKRNQEEWFEFFWVMPKDGTYLDHFIMSTIVEAEKVEPACLELNTDCKSYYILQDGIQMNLALVAELCYHRIELAFSGHLEDEVSRILCPPFLVRKEKDILIDAINSSKWEYHTIYKCNEEMFTEIDRIENADSCPDLDCDAIREEATNAIIRLENDLKKLDKTPDRSSKLVDHGKDKKTEKPEDEADLKIKEIGSSFAMGGKCLLTPMCWKYLKDIISLPTTPQECPEFTSTNDGSQPDPSFDCKQKFEWKFFNEYQWSAMPQCTVKDHFLIESALSRSNNKKFRNATIEALTKHSKCTDSMKRQFFSSLAEHLANKEIPYSCIFRYLYRDFGYVHRIKQRFYRECPLNTYWKYFTKSQFDDYFNENATKAAWACFEEVSKIQMDNKITCENEILINEKMFNITNRKNTEFVVTDDNSILLSYECRQAFRNFTDTYIENDPSNEKRHDMGDCGETCPSFYNAYISDDCQVEFTAVYKNKELNNIMGKCTRREMIHLFNSEHIKLNENKKEDHLERTTHKADMGKDSNTKRTPATLDNIKHIASKIQNSEVELEKHLQSTDHLFKG